MKKEVRIETENGKHGAQPEKREEKRARGRKQDESRVEKAEMKVDERDEEEARRGQDTRGGK